MNFSQSQETQSARKGNRFEGVNNFEYEVEISHSDTIELIHENVQIRTNNRVKKQTK